MSINAQLLTQNYFDLFQLPLVFSVDAEQLKREFLDLQQRYHPDNFASESDDQQKLAIAVSANINTGLNVLEYPVSRGQYLLKLKGVEDADAPNPKLPQITIIEQLELREALEDAQTSEDEDEVAALIDAARAKMSQIEGHIGQILDADQSTASLTEKDADQAKNLLFELQFFNKFVQEAKEIESRLLDDF